MKSCGVVVLVVKAMVVMVEVVMVMEVMEVQALPSIFNTNANIPSYAPSSSSSSSSSTSNPSSPSSSGHITLPNARQADYARRLASFDITTPVKVSSDGAFLSHHLHHTHEHGHSTNTHARRRKRGTPNSSTHESEQELNYLVTLDGKEHQVTLQPNLKLLAPHAVVEHVGGGGTRTGTGQVGGTWAQVIGVRPSCHYTGYLKNHTSSRVALSTCNGLTGYLRTDEDEYLIEPIQDQPHTNHLHPRTTTTTTTTTSTTTIPHPHAQPHQPQPHLVYKRSALPNSDANSHHTTCSATSDAYEKAIRERSLWEEKREAERQIEKEGKEMKKKKRNTKVKKNGGEEGRGGITRRQEVGEVYDAEDEEEQFEEELMTMKNINNKTMKNKKRINISNKSGESGSGGRAETSRGNKRRRRHKRSISKERNVEVTVVADKKMVEYYRNEDLTTYILTVMNMVSSVYHDASIGNAVNIHVVRIMLLEEDQYEALEVSHNADDTLKSFCRFQEMINPTNETHPHHHDVAVLLTRYNICSRVTDWCATLGVSEIAGMCQPQRSCNVNEDTGLQIAYTIAHELGHNFGMNHDGPQNGCEIQYGVSQHVMSPHLTNDAAPVTWSNCSREEITHFLDRNWGSCLEDEPRRVVYTFPELPPGAMYDADHQCRLSYGENATHCADVEGIERVCQTLWCHRDNRCVTRMEPAAEGTQCGKHKWCSGGKCVTMGERPAAIHGSWGAWSPWSACTRSCGAGVSIAVRHCDNPPPADGGRYCTGDRKRYRICNTKECPENGVSFRAIQCSQHGQQPYKGENRTWLPVLFDHSSCQLDCKPDNEFYSVKLRETVEDGTPCKPGTRDMCIHGVCKRIACDWTIEGSAQEDRCGLCHGDGTQCVTSRGVFNESRGSGYVQVVTFPEDARNVRVEELNDAANYFAIADNTTGNYYLNGDWIIHWSGEYSADGVMMYYTREGETENLLLPGPLKRPLTLMLLFQTENPGVSWEYTLPHPNATYTPSFAWQHADWSVCTVTCGAGTQVSQVQCMEKEAGLVEDKYCNSSPRPKDRSRQCNIHACPAWWWSGPWQPCSVTCGDSGTRRRTVICVRSFGPTEQMALLDSACEHSAKPHETEGCPSQAPCLQMLEWNIGAWDKTCAEDPCEYEERPVECVAPRGFCDPLSRPPDRRQCGNITCGEWETDSWSQCSADCGEGVQFRRVSCVVGLACREKDEPRSVRECTGTCLKVEEEKQKEEEEETKFEIHDVLSENSKYAVTQLSTSPSSTSTTTSLSPISTTPFTTTTTTADDDDDDSSTATPTTPTINDSTTSASTTITPSTVSTLPPSTDTEDSDVSISASTSSTSKGSPPPTSSTISPTSTFTATASTAFTTPLPSNEPAASVFSTTTTTTTTTTPPPRTPTTATTSPTIASTTPAFTPTITSTNTPSTTTIADTSTSVSTTLHDPPDASTGITTTNITTTTTTAANTTATESHPLNFNSTTQEEQEDTHSTLSSTSTKEVHNLTSSSSTNTITSSLLINQTMDSNPNLNSETLVEPPSSLPSTSIKEEETVNETPSLEASIPQTPLLASSSSPALTPSNITTSAADVDDDLPSPANRENPLDAHSTATTELRNPPSEKSEAPSDSTSENNATVASEDDAENRTLTVTSGFKSSKDHMVSNQSENKESITSSDPLPDLSAHSDTLNEVDIDSKPQMSKGETLPDLKSYQGDDTAQTSNATTRMKAKPTTFTKPATSLEGKTDKTNINSETSLEYSATESEINNEMNAPNEPEEPATPEKPVAAKPSDEAEESTVLEEKERETRLEESEATVIKEPVMLQGKKKEEEEKVNEKDETVNKEEERPQGTAVDKIYIDGFEMIEVVELPPKGKKKSRKKVLLHTGVEAVDALNSLTKKHHTHTPKTTTTTTLLGPMRNSVMPLHRWRVGSWSECTVECGGGSTERKVECEEILANTNTTNTTTITTVNTNTTTTVNTSQGNIVDASLCPHPRPSSLQPCSTGECGEWVTGVWGNCSAQCDIGVRLRTVDCPEGLICPGLQRPDEVESCNLDPCVRWVTGPWSLCTRSCGGGYQIRHVKCADVRTGKTSKTCAREDRPKHKMACQNQRCPKNRRGQQRRCKDRLDSKLCRRLKHMCSTKFFLVKCCRTCLKRPG